MRARYFVATVAIAALAVLYITQHMPAGLAALLAVWPASFVAFFGVLDAERGKYRAETSALQAKSAADAGPEPQVPIDLDQAA